MTFAFSTKLMLKHARRKVLLRATLHKDFSGNRDQNKQ